MVCFVIFSLVFVEVVGDAEAHADVVTEVTTAVIYHAMAAFA